MIERMKKITILVAEKDRDKFISILRKLGVLHVKHVKAPMAHEIGFIEDKIATMDTMISQLTPYAQKDKPDRRDITRERDVLNCAEPTEEDCKEKQELKEKADRIKKEMAWFSTWGSFDPRDLEKIKKAGANLKLYQINKHDLKKIQKGQKYYILNKEKGFIYIAVIYVETEKELPFKEVFPPNKSLEEKTKDIEEVEEKIRGVTARLEERARNLKPIKICKEKLKKEHESLKVKFGMQEEEQFSYLQGFCPAKEVKKITDMAKHNKLGYLAEEPDKPEETPTLITNPRWIKIINPVFTFMSTLPGYEEFDISFYFLAFFSLFFAMLIGDAGYGCLFLVATYIARRRLKQLPPEPFLLMYILSIGTIIWGAITGTWFGAERIAELPFFNSLIVEKIDSFADSSQNFIIFICFMIGAVQLTIAHLLRASKVINSLKALSEIGWVMILWGMFFAAGKFVLGRLFPPFAGGLLITGIGLVLLCSNPEEGILKGTLSTLAELPLRVISSFSDIVSYLRLFAVGYATVVVAESFNNMALAGGVHTVIGGLVAALILFFGHTLNIILGCMAVIVHGIRLNMLEFSSHLGMEWSGKKYDPFCEK